jgi:outer membrane protein TolC
MNATILLAVAALAQTPAAPAADTLHLTMDEAVRRALASGEEMRRARAQVQDADGQVTEALSGALPQITGSLVYTRQFASVFEDVTVDSATAELFRNSPFGAPNTWNVEVKGSQLLWSGGKVGAGLKAAKSFRAGAQAQADETAAEIAFRVKRAYLDAAVAGRLVEIARAGYEQARAHLSQVQKFQRAGTRAEYDQLRAQVDVANQEPRVVAAENGQTLAMLELRRLVNVPTSQEIELATPVMSTDGTLPVAILDSVVAPNRAAVTAAEAQVGLRQQLVRAARADRLPTLSVGATLSNQAFSDQVSPFDERFRRNWSAEARLSFPIFLGFKTSGSIRRAQAALEQARADRDQAVEQVGLDVAQARAELERAQALVGARRATVRQAERAQYLATVRYTNGIATQLEVTDARVLAQQAETNEVQATRDYLFALALLERALGRPVPVRAQSIDQIANAPTATHKEGSQP